MQTKLKMSLGLTMLVAVAGCDREASKATTRLKGDNVLLITLDTTRADRIGAYGYDRAKTPALDAIASRSALFEDAVAQVPLTLPSHGSILTGRFPKEFGVRINNQGAVGKTHPTLATIFKEKGYRTAAFVATFVLDARFGLDRGFDLYDDEMANVSMEKQPLEWERPANVVTDRALQWLDSDKEKPFFAWVHFYDPHDPYTPPEGYPKNYDGEMAFMDTQVKRLSDWLDQSGQRDKTLLVVVGDHGESFGEHGEEGHGIFLYHTSTHVPLMFAHPKLIPSPRRIANTVGAVDVFPTILEFFGWPIPEGMHSVSLVDAVLSGHAAPRAVYSESDYVWHSYGWAQQRSFTSPDWKYISSTRPELYDRRKDPAEKNNLFESQRQTAMAQNTELSRFYASKVEAKAEEVPRSAAANQALQGLGYVETARTAKDEFLTENVADPKDKLHVVDHFKAGRKLISQQKFDEAATVLSMAAQEAPESVAVHGAHALSLVGAKKYAEAIEIIETKILPVDSSYHPALISLGDAFYGIMNYQKAHWAFTLAVENDPLDPTAHYKLGRTQVELQQLQLAVESFAKAVSLFPDFPEAHFHLAVQLVNQQQYPKAIHHYREALRLKPDYAEAQYNLGAILLTIEQVDAAIPHLEEATRQEPENGRAWINLGIAYLKAGQSDRGRQAMERAAEIPSSLVEANLNLAVAAMRENDTAAARSAYEKVLNQIPGHSDGAFGLARLLLDEGQTAEAARVLDISVQTYPNNGRNLYLLAMILAASEDDSVRNGSEALRHARNAEDISRGQSHYVLEALAASEAETGDFSAAVETLGRALELLKGPENAQRRATLQQQIEQYQTQRPLRLKQFFQAQVRAGQ